MIAAWGGGGGEINDLSHPGWWWSCPAGEVMSISSRVTYPMMHLVSPPPPPPQILQNDRCLWKYNLRYVGGNKITSMHSSRMCTAHQLTIWGGVSARGCLNPLPPPPVDTPLRTDRHQWKHYLPRTSLWRVTRQHSYRMHTNRIGWGGGCIGRQTRLKVLPSLLRCR